jgi:2-oxoisovalerate dehydrogenase E2 component (dihydrolipoyl transacylase)
VSTPRVFRLPDLGEGLTEAEVVRWLVGPGDVITLNQPIAEVETAKAVVELPSPYAGTVTELFVAAGATVEVGVPIIAVALEGADQPGETPASEGAASEEAEEKINVLVGYGPSSTTRSRRRRSPHPPAAPRDVPPTPATPAPPATPAQPPAPIAGPEARPAAKPPVRFLARTLGIALTDVHGTGPGGLITREDVQRHADAGVGTDDGALALATTERETRTPIRGVRKVTAAAMVRSAFTAPHVTEFVTVDVTPTVELVDQLREHRSFSETRVTPLTLVAKAVLLALRENPSLNSSWDEEHQEIIAKHYVNLGIAAATPRGLLVPNIKDADRLTLRQLADALTALTDTARAGVTTPTNLTGGTITITNIGVFGIDGGTPILNPGEAAILCVGAFRRQPWEYQDSIALRTVCTLSLSFDHRLVDGKEGSLFLAAVANLLAEPANFIALS